MRPGPTVASLWLSATVLILLAVAVIPAATAGGEPRDVPSGLIGMAGGLAVHSGRTVVVDAVSGASTRTDEEVYLRPAFVGGLLADLGFSDLGRRLPGTTGLRISLDASTPEPFLAVASLLRYRLELAVDGRAVTGIAPWLGAGVALQWAGGPDGSPFLSFPISIGCDLEILAPGLYAGLQLDVSMFNPFGPSWSERDGAGSRQVESHTNGGAVKLAVSYRFY